MRRENNGRVYEFVKGDTPELICGICAAFTNSQLCDALGNECAQGGYWIEVAE